LPEDFSIKSIEKYWDKKLKENQKNNE
jgi:hypothetical protein